MPLVRLKQQHVRPGPEVDTSALKRTRGEFLRRGSLVALSSFAAGLRTVIAVSVVASVFGPAAVTAYGVAVSIFSVALVLCTGYTILVINKLAVAKRQKRADIELSAPLVDIFRLVAASAVILAIVVPGFGILAATLLPLDTKLFWAAYGTLTLSFVVLPFAQAIIGLQQIRGQEKANLRVSVENIAAYIILAILVRLFIHDVYIALVALGVAAVLVDFWGVHRRMKLLGSFKDLTMQRLREGIRAFGAAPLKSIKEAPKATSGALDGVVLASTFMLAAQVATSTGALSSSLTIIAITALRTFIVPLKSFGTVGGRLVRVESPSAADQPSTLFGLVRLAYALILPLSLVLFLLPDQVAALLHMTSGPEARFVIYMMAMQLLLEPITGLASSMLKVVTRPGAVLLPLTLTMWAGVTPVLVILTITSSLSLYNIWMTLLIARVVFFIAVSVALWSWARAQRIPVQPPATVPA